MTLTCRRPGASHHFLYNVELGTEHGEQLAVLPRRAMVLVVGGLRRVLVRRPQLYRHFHCSSAWAVKKVLQPFKLADIGEGITECEVIKWCVPNVIYNCLENYVL